MKRTRFGMKENGAVGIGTLIVFIAMVLVAAIAAAVLINTAGSLQDRAQKTGAEATQDVSGGIKVQHMQGWVSPLNSQMVVMRVYLALHAGTTAVNIDGELNIHMSWIDKTNSSGSIGGMADFLHRNNSNLNNGENEIFQTNITIDPHSSMLNSGVLDQDSLIYVDIEFGDMGNSTPPDANGFDPSSNGIIKFMVSNGMTPTIKGFNVPGSFPGGGGWIELY
ncbi:MAG: hypothetical protein QGG48_13555 [Desulfatiglandales bacterium]|nr:hypothetical protein [Desulfatiglandales bacterium]